MTVKKPKSVWYWMAYAAVAGKNGKRLRDGRYVGVMLVRAGDVIQAEVVARSHAGYLYHSGVLKPQYECIAVRMYESFRPAKGAQNKMLSEAEVERLVPETKPVALNDYIQIRAADGLVETTNQLT